MNEKWEAQKEVGGEGKLNRRSEWKSRVSIEIQSLTLDGLLNEE